MPKKVKNELRPKCLTLMNLLKSLICPSLLKNIVIFTKAMHWPEISVIPSFAKIDLTGIPTVENRPKISCLISAFDFRESLNETNKTVLVFQKFCFYQN